MMCSVRFFVELPRANLKAALRSRDGICINKEDILVGKVNFKNHHYETLHRHKVLRTNEWAKFLKFLIFEKLLKFKSQQSASIHPTILFLNCQKCSFHRRACREEKRRGVTFVFCLMAAPSASWTSWPETKAKMSLFQSKENVEGKCWFHLHPPNPVANGGNDEWNSSVCRSLVDAVPLAVVCQITIRHQDAPESAGSRNMFTAFTDPLSCFLSRNLNIFLLIVAILCTNRMRCRRVPRDPGCKELWCEDSVWAHWFASDVLLLNRLPVQWPAVRRRWHGADQRIVSQLQLSPGRAPVSPAGLPVRSRLVPTARRLHSGRTQRRLLSQIALS